MSVVQSSRAFRHTTLLRFVTHGVAKYSGYGAFNARVVYATLDPIALPESDRSFPKIQNSILSIAFVESLLDLFRKSHIVLLRSFSGAV